MKEFFIKINKSDLNKKAEIISNEIEEYHDEVIVTGDIRIENKDNIVDLENCNKDISDKDLVLKLYLKYGKQFVEIITGAFAIVIHDRREQILLLFRDNFGQKNIYFTDQNDCFHVSSSIKGIFENSSVSKEMNIERVIDFIAHTHSPSSETFFKNIYNLGPAKTLELCESNIEINSYVPEVNYTAKDVKEIFFEAIDATKDENFGCMLSGGLDSSSISIASQILNKEPLNVFSIVFPQSKSASRNSADEEEYSTEVANSYDMKHEKITVTEFNFIENIKKNIEYYDEPYMATNTYIYEKVFEQAQKKGIKVILDGTDGDSVISHGTEIFRYYGETFQIKKLLHEKKAYDYLHNRKFSVLKTILSFVIKPKLPKFLLRLYKRIRNQDFFVYQNNLLHKNFKKDLTDLYSSVDEIHEIDQSFNNFSKKAHYQMVYKSHWHEVFNILNTIGGKYGIEVRYPFFYQGLVDFCIKTPVHKKIKNGVTRYYFREGLKKILPKKIYQRQSKSDLSPLFLKHFMKLDENYVEKVFFNKNSPVYNLINQRSVRKLLDSKNPNKNLSIIYTFFSLYEWMKKNDFYVDIVK